MDKFKILSILEGIIIVVLVVLLINKNNTTEPTLSDKTNDKANTEIKQEQKETKNYIGIYHNSNYNNATKDVNIILYDNNTCEVSIYKNDVHKCDYKVIDKDNIQLIISTYIGFNDARKDKTLANSFVTGWKLAPTKEKCESILKDYKDKNPSQYEDYTECVKVEETHNITLLENGLLYEDRQFSKIK